MIAAFLGVMNIEVTNAPGLSVGGPPLAPSWISVVLVEEAKAGGTPRFGCPREDQDIRLLAGVAMPASMTICDDSFGSPCVGGTLFSSDIAGTWYLMGYHFPIGAVNPAGPDDLYVAGGPVGPHGTLSPSDSDPAGSDGPYVAGGPAGPDGTCSRFSLTLLARLGQCPHLTRTLLAPTACRLRGAPLVQMRCCPRLSLTLPAQLARMLQVALLAHLGRCLHLSLILMARMARMFHVWDIVSV